MKKLVIVLIAILLMALPFASACTGSEGERGPQGIQGEQGLRGNPGNPGNPGNTGLQGQPGATGPAGPTGPKGSQGTRGPTGATGPQGSQGYTGAQGPAGLGGSTAALTLSDSAVYRGNDVWVYGSGFTPGQYVQIYGTYSLEKGSGTWSVYAHAGSYGHIRAKIYVPTSASRGKGATISANVGGVTVATTPIWIR